MNLLMIVLSLSLSFVSFAQSPDKQAGQEIKASDFNSAKFNIGDIKTSILNVVQFNAINGDCWKLMNGDPISGSDLSTLTGMSNLPDMTSQGRFIRQAKAGRILASLEEDENKEHTHSLVFHQDSGGGGSPNNAVHGSASINAISKTTSTSGGLEARPKNMAVNMFIKINKVCNY